MPHARERLILPQLKKALSFWPVVCVVGARQVGKSTLLRGLKGYAYKSLDDDALRALAESSPQSVLQDRCVIDEAQKAPGLFDAVKLAVDEARRPGRFLLTGSVRFSKRTLIRESLTGRARTLQLFPFIGAEACELPFDHRFSGKASPPRVGRSQFLKFAASGGMPAAFAIRNAGERAAYWSALIESYVHRDLLMAMASRPDPRTAMDILRSVADTLALGEQPTLSRILKKTMGNRAKVVRHVEALVDMMILNRVPHWGASATKDAYLPFDAGLLLGLLKVTTIDHDKAIFRAVLRLTLLKECQAQAQYAGVDQDIYYAESPKGELVDLIIDRGTSKRAYQLSIEPIPHAYVTRYAKAWAKDQNGTLTVLSSASQASRADGLDVRPWEAML